MNGVMLSCNSSHLPLQPWLAGGSSNSEEHFFDTVASLRASVGSFVASTAASLRASAASGGAESFASARSAYADASSAAAAGSSHEAARWARRAT